MIRTLTVERLRVVRLPGDLALWLKALLVAMLAVQTARLIWILVTPVGPLGDWRPTGATIIPPAAQAAVIAAVNPFDRMASFATTATNLPTDLKLFGVRAGGGSVPGGAIIGLPDGQQISVSVGEAVMPGVKLVAVGFDFAEVERQGARQRLFMDQDKPTETVTAGGAAVPSVDAPPATAAPSVDAVRAAVNFAPRQSATGLTGIAVAPNGNSPLFTLLGFRSADVIVAVNGTNITSVSDLAKLQQSLAPGAMIALTVERDGQQVPISFSLAGS